MCFSAMVEQKASELADQFSASINWNQLQESLEQQFRYPSHIKTASAMQKYYLEQDSSPAAKKLADQIAQLRKQKLQEELLELNNEIYDLEYVLAKKHTKTNEQKKISKQNKKNRLLEKLDANNGVENWESHFIFPHWKLFACYFNNETKNIEVSDFEYGHFRDTGVFIEDVLYHLGKHPKSPKYSLYNSKIESLSSDYFTKTKSQLKSIHKKRIENAKLLLEDFKKKKGVFENGLDQKIMDFLESYQWDSKKLEIIQPTQQSYLEALFPNNRAVVKASAFREMVLESDYFNKKQSRSNKHIAIDFYQEEDVYFPAVYSKYGENGYSLRALSIITTEPRPEVLAKGHDRSPICLSKEGALAYLEESLLPDECFELFEHYQISSPFQSKLVGA
jgi:hypothetical protein